MSAPLVGVVVRVEVAARYGFISAARRMYFVHASRLPGEALTKGLWLRFRPTQDSRGRRADDVVVLMPPSTCPKCDRALGVRAISCRSCGLAVAAMFENPDDLAEPLVIERRRPAPSCATSGGRQPQSEPARGRRAGLIPRAARPPAAGTVRLAGVAARRPV